MTKFAPTNTEKSKEERDDDQYLVGSESSSVLTNEKIRGAEEGAE